jgi:hypothetical protein
MNHFKGKSALSHVIDARMKGRLASAEVHGTELAGHVSAAADAAKESAFYILLLWTFLSNVQILLLFTAALTVWKAGRSALLGWSRLERLHRVIEEERYEIEHHRDQEKEELRALYAAKGFSGKLLDEVVEVLMADDNRLLQVMLEEELGLNLESHEHPLKQALGALLGVIGSALVLSVGIFILPSWGVPLCAGLVIALSAGTTAQLEKNRPLPAIVWNLAVTALATGISYFLSQVLL